MLVSLLTGTASLALGAAGWFIAKFLAEPLLSIYALRMEVQETLIRSGNLQPNALEKDREDAALMFRSVGAKLSAHHLAAWPWVQRFYERILKWDPYSAGESCMGIGLMIRSEGFSHPNLSGLGPTLREDLVLPPWPSPTKRERALYEKAGWGAPPDASSYGG